MAKDRIDRDEEDLVRLYLTDIGQYPLLTKDDEVRLAKAIEQGTAAAAELEDPTVKVTAAKRRELRRAVRSGQEAERAFVQSNLRLVVSIAKRHVSQADELFGLISDGNMSLIRAVEKFDFARGNKFSTYASWAIMKNFARTIPHEFRQRDRFRTSSDEMFQATEDDRQGHYEQEAAQQLREVQIGRILSRLDEREQKIIISRYGLDHREEPKTLKEVGAEMGVTKERIRQIEARALTKLRQAMQEEHIDLLLE